MKSKELYMDCVTGIFVRVNSLKYPTREQYIERVRADVYRRLALQEPQFIVIKADAAVSAIKPVLEDIDAVNLVFKNCIERDKEYICDAIKAVYFQYKGSVKIPNKIIKERILSFSMTYPAHLSTVYRWLKEARALCAYYRGITIQEPSVF